MAAIVLSNIEKSFETTRVLNGVDLAIHAGEFLTLVGPSGCGKSTLLRILAGLEAPSAGEVRIADKVVNAVRAADRNLAMVFQSYALYPHLTVSENMMTPLKLRDLNFRERFPILGPLFARSKYHALLAQVEETARTLRIDALLDRKPGQLSGGQRQRVALGRAMVRKPLAFLMDEPLSNLDAALRVHMRSELAELHRSLGATFVYVTHDQAEALTMSDRMAVMMGGDILQLDSPSAIYDDPASVQVAEFIGSPKINLLPCAADDDGFVTARGLNLRRRLAGHGGGDLTLGLRPEHLNITGASGDGSLSGTVVHRENLGSDFYLHLSVAEGAHRIVVRATPLEATDLAIGDTVNVEPAPGKAMVFGAEGGRRRFTAAEDEQPVSRAVA